MVSEIFFFCNPYGYGPVGRAATLIAQLSSLWSGRIVFIGSRFCLEIIDKSNVETFCADELDEAKIEENLVNKTNAAVISCANPYVLKVAHRLSIPSALIDSLTWFWKRPGPDYLTADHYFAVDFPGVTHVQQHYPNIHIVPAFGAFPTENHNKKTGIARLIHLGGLTSPIDPQLPVHYLKLIAQAIQEVALTSDYPLAVVGNPEAIEYLKQEIGIPEIHFTTMIHAKFLETIKDSEVLVTTPGIGAFTEALSYGIPCSFLPPVSLSQWAILRTLRSVDAAPVSTEWEEYCNPISRLDEIQEHMSRGIFPEIAARVWEDNSLRDACVKRLVEIISAVPDVDGQRQLRKQLGSQGEVIVCQMLAKIWNL